MGFVQLSLLALATAIAYVYFWFKQKQDYWLKRSIPAERSSLFFFARTQHTAYYLQNIYRRCKSNQFIGMFIAFSPALVVFDLDLLKNIFIKDFEHFPDHGFYYNIRDDPLSSNILRLRGEQWKRLRTKLTPTFSSAKIKFMCSTLVGVAERFTAVLNDLLEEQIKANHVHELEIRDLCARYTTDVIGSVAFGIECNSLCEPNTEFRLMGDKAFSCFNPVFEAVAANHEELFQKLHVTAFTKELIDFYTKIVKDNIEYRETTGLRRNDFLDTLIELKNARNEDGDSPLTIEEAIGQAFVFFIGGFETSSSTMAFCLYELSRNQDIQEKARQDVLDNLAKYNNVLTYECLRDMRYLETIILETLRKYPVVPTLKRVARKPYQMPNSEYIIETNMTVLIPVYAIHHDPEYYPQPDKFDPERFTAAEIQKRHPMAYLPFGAGPRICIAERFGKMQALIGLAMLLRDFKFDATDMTPQVLEFDLKNLRIFSVKGGIHLKVEKV